ASFSILCLTSSQASNCSTHTSSSSGPFFPDLSLFVMATRSSMTSPTALLTAGCFLVLLLIQLPTGLASQIDPNCKRDTDDQLTQLDCTELVEQANGIIEWIKAEIRQIILT